MKKILLSLLIVLFGISVIGQQLTKQDYLNKSKSQKTWATILTAGGGAMIIGGIISYASESSTSYYPGKTVGTVLMISGAAAVTGGIILFSASKKNQKKANEMNVAFHLEFQSADVYRYNSLAKNYYPAVSLHVGLK